MKYINYSLFIACFLYVNTAIGQTFELKFEEVSKNGTEYIVDVQIAFSSVGKLGSSNLLFQVENLENPTLESHNLTDSAYSISVKTMETGKISLNIDLRKTNLGDNISTAPNWSNIARIRFDAIDNTALASLRWSYYGGTTETVIFLDNNSTRIQTNSLSNLQNAVNIALPVELCCFEATLSDENVHLIWTTYSEINNSHFNIQRSNDRQEFTTIGKVEGNGTSIEQHNYQFTDISPKEGENYYRLQQVDFNNHYEYSNIKLVTIGKTSNQNITIFPNPVKDKLNIDVGNYEVKQSIKIINNQGNVLKTLQPSQRVISVSELSAGIYFLVIDEEIKIKWVKI